MVLNVGMTTTLDTAPAHFLADLARFDRMFARAGAVKTLSDGFTYLDRDLLSDQTINAYQSLLSVGYYNGWIA